MKSIILGLSDYFKDKWHDFLVYRLFKIYRRPMYFSPPEDDDRILVPIVEWREGSVWHYIRQRRYSAKIKRMKDERKTNH